MALAERTAPDGIDAPVGDTEADATTHGTSADTQPTEKRQL
jgi:hypothetical protein